MAIFQDIEEAFAKEEKLRKELEEKGAKILQEKNDLFQQLQQERDNVGDSEQRASKLLSQKTDLEKQISVSQVFNCNILHKRKFRNFRTSTTDCRIKKRKMRNCKKPRKKSSKKPIR